MKSQNPLMNLILSLSTLAGHLNLGCHSPRQKNNLPPEEVEAIRAVRQSKKAQREINNIRAALLNPAWK